MQRGGPICASSTIDGPLFLTLPSQKSCFQNLINIYWITLQILIT